MEVVGRRAPVTKAFGTWERIREFITEQARLKQDEEARSATAKGEMNAIKDDILKEVLAAHSERWKELFQDDPNRRGEDAEKGHRIAVETKRRQEEQKEDDLPKSDIGQYNQ